MNDDDSDDFDGGNEDEDIDVDAVVVAAIQELLAIAAGVADLQTTEQGADDIMNLCDIVAEYYQIERSRAVLTEHDDGSYTTSFELFVGGGALEREIPAPGLAKPRPSIPGSIRTLGKIKFRLIDKESPPTSTDDDDD